jgi:hypothetical protein
MLKVYEGKREAHCWMIPLKEVIELHKSSAETMSGGISLNDVQLVQTYIVEDTFAFHIETFDPDPRRERNLYGRCTWVGGMVLHRIEEDEHESPQRSKAQEFAMLADEEMAQLTERRGKTRERRARKKAEVKTKKEEEAQELQKQQKLAKEQEEAEAAVKRREALVRPHASLSRLLKGADEQEEEEEDSSDDGEGGALTEAELAIFTNSAPSRHKEGLLKPHPSLNKMLIDGARSRG